LRACGTSDDTGEIDDQKAVQSSRRPLFPRHPARQLRSHDRRVPSLLDPVGIVAQVYTPPCCPSKRLGLLACVAIAFSNGCYEKDQHRSSCASTAYLETPMDTPDQTSDSRPG